MKKLDSLIFIVIAGLIFLCVIMEYRLAERKIQLMPTPKLPVTAKGDSELERMIRSTASSISIDPPPRRNPFALPLSILKGGTNDGSGFDINLTAICWSREKPLAIIDGRVMAEGDSDPQGRFTVERIYPDEILVDLSGGRRKIIKLNEVIKR